MVSVHPEVQRRLVHSLGALVPLGWAVGVYDWRAVQGLWVFGLVVALALEAGRLLGGLESWVYDRLTREYEQENLAGYALYTVSMTAVALAVSVGLGVTEGVAAASMLMLAIGDPVSGLLGSGELQSVKRTYVLLVMFGTCTLLAVPFVPSWVAAAAGGAAATLADGVKPVVAGYVVDDNLTIPPAAATAMAVVLAVV
jgi:dolichol kinase